jgi:hypothetical protein
LELFDTLSTLNKKSLTMRPTRVCPNSATVIDNIITNIELAAVKTNVITSHISDHIPLHSTFTLNLPHSVKTLYKRVFSDENLATFTEMLNSHNWSTLYNICSFEDSFNYFYSTFTNYFDFSFPNIRIKHKNFSLTSNRKPWVTDEIRGFASFMKDMGLY